MKDAQQVREVTINMLNDLIDIHSKVTHLCIELADQTNIDEVSKTMRTTAIHYQSTIANLHKLVSSIEDPNTADATAVVD